VDTLTEASPILIVLVVVVFAVLAYFAYKQQAARRAALAELALSLGWQFDPSKDYSHSDRYAHFSPFGTGSSRCAYNTLTGNLSSEPLGAFPHQHFLVTMGDYQYTTTSGSGKSRRTTTHQLSYLIVELPLLRTPTVKIRPENAWDKLTSMLGFDDIDFESVEFSNRFHVSSDDKRLAYDLVNPRMMEFLLANPGPTIEIERRQCCLIERQRCWDAAQFAAQLEWMRQFLALWPPHVIQLLTQIP
jgi:hypothetical protein